MLKSNSCFCTAKKKKKILCLPKELDNKHYRTEHMKTQFTFKKKKTRNKYSYSLRDKILRKADLWWVIYSLWYDDKAIQNICHDGIFIKKKKLGEPFQGLEKNRTNQPYQMVGSVFMPIIQKSINFWHQPNLKFLYKNYMQWLKNTNLFHILLKS